MLRFIGLSPLRRSQPHIVVFISVCRSISREGLSPIIWCTVTASGDGVYTIIDSVVAYRPTLIASGIVHGDVKCTRQVRAEQRAVAVIMMKHYI